MNRTEEALHIAVAQYLHVALPPDWIWTSIEMGVHTSKSQAGRLKAKGCRRGWPDIQIMPPVDTLKEPQPVGMLFIELKAPKGYPSKAQKELHGRLMNAGYDVAVCRSVEEVERFLWDCGVPLRASCAAT